MLAFDLVAQTEASYEPRSVSKLLWVCLGGALGSGARYLVSLGMARWVGASWPYGTLTVNVLGSLLLGFLLERFTEAPGLSVGLRLALTTGAMGGFTTYSTFNYETLSLFQSGRTVAAGSYVAVTLVGCLMAGTLGILAARSLAA